VSPEQIKRILIVEDSEDVQMLLGRFLENEGYTVVYANNGREALEYLRKSEEVPGVILLDLMMPGMDGYEFRREQELHAPTASIPVVVMTADGNIQSKAMKIGANGFLRKPFTDLDLISQTVESFFSNQQH
jgi:CheY-like chemotaxis protein